MKTHSPRKHWYSCPTCVQRNGYPKRAYTTRSNAKKALRNHHDQALRIYKCPHHPGTFHLGHVPKSLRQGHISRNQIQHKQYGTK